MKISLKVEESERIRTVDEVLSITFTTEIPDEIAVDSRSFDLAIEDIRYRAVSWYSKRYPETEVK